MTFRGVCKISLLAARQQVFVAPLLFFWVIAIHQVLGISISNITILLVGSIISVYQQFNACMEDKQDGFYDHCRFNGLPIYLYALAKSFANFSSTLLPMTLALLILGNTLAESFLICLQWTVLSLSVSFLLTFSTNLNPLNLLLGWFPVITAPMIFLVDYLTEMNKSSLFIFLGCDILLMSGFFVPFVFIKNRSVKNVFPGS